MLGRKKYTQAKQNHNISRKERTDIFHNTNWILFSRTARHWLPSASFDGNSALRLATYRLDMTWLVSLLPALVPSSEKRMKGRK